MAGYYTTSSSSVDYYSDSTSSTEPDMRQEIINTLDGCWPEVAKRQYGLFRKMRRDSDNKLIACECVDRITKEATRDRFCPLCFGCGWYWDETLVTYYRALQGSGATGSVNVLANELMGPGLINVPLVVFYVRYSEEITQEDKIVELILDNEGDPEEPYQRKNIYRINTIWDYRSDRGRLEYWKLYTHLEKVKYLNAPTFEDL